MRTRSPLGLRDGRDGCKPIVTNELQNQRRTRGSRRGRSAVATSTDLIRIMPSAIRPNALETDRQSNGISGYS
jgi:hypothetical protein